MTTTIIMILVMALIIFDIASDVFSGIIKKKREYERWQKLFAITKLK